MAGLSTFFVPAQPLMAYPPFYNMPFPYPPAASGAQVPSELAAGASVAEKKPGETNGQSKSGDDSSPPVCVLSIKLFKKIPSCC